MCFFLIICISLPRNPLPLEYNKSSKIPNRILLLFFPLRVFLLMQIFLLRCQSTSDMTFLFIHFQYISHFFCQCRINLAESVSTVFMYSRFRNPKSFRRLSHRCIILYNKLSDLHGSFFNIIFQRKSPAYIFLQCMQGIIILCTI